MSPVTGLARAIVGLIQGLALFLLYRVAEAKGWPATEPRLFAPLVATAIFVPLLVIVGLSNLRPATLAIWTIAAVTLCAGFGWYDIYREGTVAASDFRPIMLPPTWIALAAVLFILYSLIVAGDAERRLIASYPSYFDVSWKLVAQAVLAAFFTGTFWGLLWLGAELFRLIRLEFLYDLIKHEWFWIPVTTVAAASALHVTDVRATLVRGVRTLKLTLLSWLLPMMTLLAVAFVLALPFTGLEPLWSTRRATSILLSSAAAIVVLINAAYQDGQPETPIAPVLRYSRLVAAFVIVPLVGLAGYGLLLRVQQYGWTPQRIFALACFVVLACYATGYAVAGASSGPTLRGLQLTNIGAAYVILAVLLMLFSPIADPARISVADQMARLRSGQTPVDKMDPRFLRFESGRFGREALHQLAEQPEGPQGAAVAERAQQALAVKSRYQATTPAFVPRFTATPTTRAANINVLYPVGQSLPRNFLEHDWTVDAETRRFTIPNCLTGDGRCDAILIDIDGDGRFEILLFASDGTGTAFQTEDDGAWIRLGAILNTNCKGVREALRAGHFEIASHPFKDIEVAGQRLEIGPGCAQ